jgi:hypothetical protein
VDNDAITYAKLQNVSATSRLLGRFTAGAGDAEEITGTQATTLLDVFTSALKGLAPASGGGTTNFLRADGSWAAPAGGGSPGGSNTQFQFNNSGAFGGTADLTWDSVNKQAKFLNGTGHFEIGLDSSYNAVFGHAFASSDNVKQYEFKYYSSGAIQTSGFKLSDVGNGFTTVITQLGGSGGLYWTDGAGNPGKLLVGTWSNPGDSQELRATAGHWYTSGADLFGINGQSAGAQFQVTANAAAVVGVTIKLAASQSANAWEVQPNGSTTPLAAFLAGGGLLMKERADPTAPAADNGILYVRDNGSGKSQLVVRFPTGAIQVISTEP